MLVGGGWRNWTAREARWTVSRESARALGEDDAAAVPVQITGACMLLKEQSLPLIAALL
jgi:hypothetical protein